ncbi:MAG: CDP-6-deoxy-delta-3,4-glucoseen reductase [Betaproteobacteria bacterium]|nr:CDP-6-deoxy-delta-3,4-glucoseen reductase [Betaproteobacteria bacterium]
MTHRVTLKPSASQFICAPGQAILKAGLAAGLRMPFSCRSGMCRTCKGRVVSGRVDFGDAHVKYLSDAEREQGFALLCCASALSDLVVEVQEINPDRHLAPQRMPARVLSFEALSPDVRIVTLGLPANEPVQFRAGQFIDVLRPDGARRSYSIATMPEAAGVRQLELHIRHMPGGVFTDHVFGPMKLREIWQIEMPLGSFYLREESAAPMVMLCSGTGFAPIHAMVEDGLARGLRRPIHLYWGGRKRADLYRADKAQAWADAHPHIRFTPVLSEATASDAWSGRTGLVHQAVLQDHPDLSGMQVYACGAPVMVEAARRDFVQQAGLCEAQFFADSFLSAADQAVQPA